MAVVRRHLSLVLRVSLAALCGLALWRDAAHAQGDPGAAKANPGITPLPSDAQPTMPDQERVVDIQIIGNSHISRDKVLSNIGTRIDRPFDQATFERDIRKLSAKNWFVHVHPRPLEHVPGGVVIILEVVERPTVQYIQFVGCSKGSIKRALIKDVGIKKGDASTPTPSKTGCERSKPTTKAKASTTSRCRSSKATSRATAAWCT